MWKPNLFWFRPDAFTTIRIRLACEFHVSALSDLLLLESGEIEPHNNFFQGHDIWTWRIAFGS